jgi:hypothetical protein
MLPFATGVGGSHMHALENSAMIPSARKQFLGKLQAVRQVLLASYAEDIMLTSMNVIMA